MSLLDVGWSTSWLHREREEEEGLERGFARSLCLGKAWGQDQPLEMVPGFLLLSRPAPLPLDEERWLGWEVLADESK